MEGAHTRPSSPTRAGATHRRSRRTRKAWRQTLPCSGRLGQQELRRRSGSRDPSRLRSRCRTRASRQTTACHLHAGRHHACTPSQTALRRGENRPLEGAATYQGVHRTRTACRRRRQFHARSEQRGHSPRKGPSTNLTRCRTTTGRSSRSLEQHAVNGRPATHVTRGGAAMRGLSGGRASQPGREGSRQDTSPAKPPKTNSWPPDASRLPNAYRELGDVAGGEAVRSVQVRCAMSYSNRSFRRENAAHTHTHTHGRSQIDRSRG